MAQALVRNWMSKEAVTVSPNANIVDAYNLMVQHEVRRLAVVNGEEKLVGIVTMSDLHTIRPFDQMSASLLELSRDFSGITSEMPIEEVMAPNPITVEENSSIVEAAQKMLDFGISGLPVVNSLEQLVGIFTEADMFRFVVESELIGERGSMRIPVK